MEAYRDEEYDEAILHEQVREGLAASRVLGEPIIKHALLGMHRAVWDTFREVPARDNDGLVYCRQMATVLDDFEANLREVLETGNLAAMQLRMKERMKAIAEGREPPEELVETDERGIV